MRATWLSCLPKQSLVILLLGTSLVHKTKQEQTSPLQTLVQAERDFAKDSVARSTREAFIEAFADDGIGFQPEPTKVKTDLQKQPAPTGPRRSVLNWSPIVAEISQAGDMGYTTGPFVVENLQSHARLHGLYSSLWKKQPSGAWKVVLDMGVSTPNEVAMLDTPISTPTEKDTERPLKYEAALSDLKKAETGFGKLLASAKFESAYQKYSLDRTRLHRPAAMPLTNQREVLDWAKQQKHEVKLSRIKLEMAQSGDFGYSYGSYEAQSEGKSKEKGYYTHIWRWVNQKGWRLILEVENPLPKA